MLDAVYCLTCGQFFPRIADEDEAKQAQLAHIDATGHRGFITAQAHDYAEKGPTIP